MATIDPISAALNLGTTLIDKFFTSDADKDAARLKLLELTQSGELTKFTAAAGIVRAEAESDHWLTANWRPIVMLTFAALIVARWFGWAAPNLAEAEYIKLWDIVQLGLGGYVIGKSAETISGNVAKTVIANKEAKELSRG